MFGLTWVDGLLFLVILGMLVWLVRRVLGSRTRRAGRARDDDWASRLVEGEEERGHERGHPG